MKKYTWDSLEKCIDAAKTCSSLSEFAKKFSGAYDKCVNKKWLTHIYAVLPPRHKNRTKCDCQNLVKKYKYLSEILKNDFAGYHSCKNKYKDIFSNAIRKTRELSNEEVINLSKKYTYIAELQKNDPSLYAIIRRRNLQTEAFSHMRKIGNRLKRAIYVIKTNTHVYVGLSSDTERRYSQHLDDSSKDIITKNAHEFKILTDYINAYEAGKIEKKLIKHYKKKTKLTVINIREGGEIGIANKKYTEDYIMDIVSKYTDLKTFMKKERKLYRHIMAYGEQEKYLTNLNRRQAKPNLWTFEYCLNTASKCASYSEFREKYITGYGVACRNKWNTEIKKLFE